jgi:hypothetical protein
MSNEEPASPGQLGADARRSPRFRLAIPLEAAWKTPIGEEIRESAHALEVNLHGGLIQMSRYPHVGHEVEIRNPAIQASTRARVVALRRNERGEICGAAIELLSPSDAVWGLTFRIKKASDDLVHLERELHAGGVDQRVLRDFRDAVDYVRKTAWVVYEWQERLLLHHDASTVLPLLSNERVRRTTQLARAITSDLDGGQVTPATPGLEELLQAVDLMRVRLSQLTSSTSSG